MNFQAHRQSPNWQRNVRKGDPPTMYVRVDLPYSTNSTALLPEGRNALKAFVSMHLQEIKCINNFWISYGTVMHSYYNQLLPHAKFPVLKTPPYGALEDCSIASRSLVTKIMPKHRAYPTYNIPKARPKRISRSKVMLILLLKFIFPSHGSL